MTHGWADAAYDRARYGREHKALRAQWVPVVATGRVTCWRCGRLIRRSQRWHLGHNDRGTEHRGPEHADCNVQGASREAHSRRWGRDPEPKPRTRWRRS